MMMIYLIPKYSYCPVLVSPIPKTYFLGESDIEKKKYSLLCVGPICIAVCSKTLTDGYFARQDLALSCGMYKMIDTWNPRDFGMPKR